MLDLSVSISLPVALPIFNSATLHSSATTACRSSSDERCASSGGSVSANLSSTARTSPPIKRMAASTSSLGNRSPAIRARRISAICASANSLRARLLAYFGCPPRCLAPGSPPVALSALWRVLSRQSLIAATESNSPSAPGVILPLFAAAETAARETPRRLASSACRICSVTINPLSMSIVYKSLQPSAIAGHE